MKKTYNIYILDTTTYGSYGNKYFLLVKKYFELYHPNENLDCFIDNPSAKMAAEEEISAEKIMNCDYCLVLYSNKLNPQDQIIFARSKKKQIIKINVDDFEKHQNIDKREVDDFWKKNMNISADDEEVYSCTQSLPTYSMSDQSSSNAKYKRNGWLITFRLMMSSIIVVLTVALLLKYILTITLFLNHTIEDILKKINGNVNSFLGTGDVFIEIEDTDIIFIMFCMVFIFIVFVLLKKVIIYVSFLISEWLSIYRGDDTFSDTNSSIPKDMYDIFISYAHINEYSDLTKLVEYLIRNHYNPWFDRYLTRCVGGNYHEMIAAHILECKSFMPLINQEYVDSEYCRDEFFYARGKNKYIVPIFLEKVRLTPGMEMRLMQQIQCINLYDFQNRKEFYQHIDTILKQKHV